MKLKLTFILLAMALPVTTVLAAPGDMAVTTWEGDCEHTMTTNHFELAPGESIEMDLSMEGCRDERLGGMLYWGYKTTRNSSKPLTNRDKIQLTLVDDASGGQIVSTDGSIFTQVTEAGQCRLYAKNIGRKTIKIRLRSSLGL